MNKENNSYMAAKNKFNDYPIIIFNLASREIFISKEEYNYDILILNTTNLPELHHAKK